MEAKLCIYICNSLVPEVSHVIQSGGYTDVKVKSFPAVCIGCTLNDQRIEEMVAGDIEQFSKIVVIVSSCCVSRKVNQPINKKIEVIQLEQCFEIFFSLPTIYYFAKQGNYIVSNGWLRNYERHVREWGFDKVLAKSFFGESMQKILLLETGLPGDYMPNLTALSEYMGLPYDIIPIGTSHLQKLLDSLVFKWRNEIERTSLNERLAKLTRESADYSLVFSQLKNLINLTEESVIMKDISNLLDILFGPSQICYHQYLPKSPTNNYCIKQSGSQLEFNPINSFAIIFKNKIELLGKFEVIDVKFPQFIPQYEKIGAIISQIGVLTITNARKYSELEKTRMELIISEEHFRTMFDQAPLGIALVNSLNGEIHDVNPKFAAITGRTREEMRTINWKNITHPDDLQEDLDNMARLNAGEIKGFKMNKRYIKPDRTIVWINMTIEPITVEDKTKPFHLCMIEDITQRKQAEDELRKFSLIVDQSPVSIVITDIKGNIEYVNPKFTQITGYSFKEAIGQNPRILKSGETPSNEYKQLWDMASSGNEWFGELHNKKKNGELYWEAARISAIKNDWGAITHYLAIKEDITQRKQAEDALKTSEANLREANATKDKFFSIIAHDLKNPFNSILGFSYYLVEQVQEKNYEGIEEYAQIIQNSSQRVFDLLMNLLEWSHSQTGRMQFNPENFELVELINDVNELLSDSAQQKSIILSREIPLNIPVVADKAMISTVLRNLISNAIKFTHPGGKIVVSTEPKEGEWLVAICDNGVGIKKEAIEKLFRIDETYSTTGTNNEEGTGLGLILCKDFIEKHGGKIWVESEEGMGSKFCFTIPKV